MLKLSISVLNGAKLLVKKGDEVAYDQPIFEISDYKHTVIDIAQKLSIDPNQIFSYLKKVIGDEISEGEVIAEKKGIIRKKTVKSTQDGIITAIDHEKGNVTLSTSKKTEGKRLTDKQKIPAHFIGSVDNILQNNILINFASGHEIALQTINQDLLGQLFYFEDEKLYFTLSEDQIFEKIVIIENLKYHIAAKCEALGALGFITCINENSTDLGFATIGDKKIFNTLFINRRSYAAASKRDKKLIIYG